LGHDVKSVSKAMPDQYDNPNLDDIHAEMAEKTPEGPLGRFGIPRVELIDYDLPGEVKGLIRQYLAGGIGTMELASRLEHIRMDLMARSKDALTE